MNKIGEKMGYLAFKIANFRLKPGFSTQDPKFHSHQPRHPSNGLATLKLYGMDTKSLKIASEMAEIGSF